MRIPSAEPATWAVREIWDLEVGLTLEALRVKAVKDGAGPMPAHREIASFIGETGNCYGAKKDRSAWMDGDVRPAEKADIMYFAGCSSSYENPQIPKAVTKVLQSAGIPVHDDGRRILLRQYSVFGWYDR